MYSLKNLLMIGGNPETISGSSKVVDTPEKTNVIVSYLKWNILPYTLLITFILYLFIYLSQHRTNKLE